MLEPPASLPVAAPEPLPEPVPVGSLEPTVHAANNAKPRARALFMRLRIAPDVPGARVPGDGWWGT